MSFDLLPWKGGEKLPTSELFSMLGVLDGLIQEAEAAVDAKWGQRHLEIIRKMGTLRDGAACLVLLERAKKHHFFFDEDGKAAPLQ